MDIVTPTLISLSVSIFVVASVVKRSRSADQSGIPKRFLRRPSADRPAHCAVQVPQAKLNDQAKPANHDALSKTTAEETVQFHLSFPAAVIENPDGTLSENGQRNLQVLATKMREKPYHVAFEVSCRARLPAALACIQYLYHVQGIDSQRLGVIHDVRSRVPSNRIGVQFQSSNRMKRT